MMLNVNCIYNYDFNRCKNTNIKRSICGIGPRNCVLYREGIMATCKFQTKHERPPIAPPSPPLRRMMKEEIDFAGIVLRALGK